RACLRDEKASRAVGIAYGTTLREIAHLLAEDHQHRGAGENHSPPRFFSVRGEPFSSPTDVSPESLTAQFASALCGAEVVTLAGVPAIFPGPGTEEEANNWTKPFENVEAYQRIF